MGRIALLTCALIVIASAAYAGTLTIPNTFSNGTTADATEVNANFTAVKTEVDDNDSRIDSLESHTTAEFMSRVTDESGGSTSYLNASGTWTVPPAGSGCSTGGANRVQYGDGSSGCNDEADFSYNPTTNTLTVGSVETTGGTDGTYGQVFDQNTTEIGEPSTSECKIGFVGTTLNKHCNGGSLTSLEGGSGTVTTSGTPVANDIARFTDATTIEGRSYAETRADLSLEVGTDVMSQTQTFSVCETLYAPNENIAATDDIDDIWRASDNLTITSIWCTSDQTITLDLEWDNVAINGSAISCNGTEDTSFAGTATATDGDSLDLAIATATGSPTRLSVCWEYDFD